MGECDKVCDNAGTTECARLRVNVCTSDCVTRWATSRPSSTALFLANTVPSAADKDSPKVPCSCSRKSSIKYVSKISINDSETVSGTDAMSSGTMPFDIPVITFGASTSTTSFKRPSRISIPPLECIFSSMLWPNKDASSFCTGSMIPIIVGNMSAGNFSSVSPVTFATPI